MKNKCSDLRNKKNVLRYCCGTWHIYEYEYIVVQNMEFERFGSFLRYIGYFTREAENVGAFAKWRQTKLSNVLSQDNSQLFPERQLRRNCTLGIVPAQGRGIHEPKRGENWTARSHSQTFTTYVSFKHHYTAPFSAPRPSHTLHIYFVISKRRRCHGDLQPQFHDVEDAVGSTHCVIFQRYV